jgi:hypothetical protein
VADLDVKCQLSHDLTQKGSPASHRLEQRDPQIGTGERHRDAGQACAGPEIHYVKTRRDQTGEGRTVEDVPAPHPLGLARTEQPPVDAWAGQQLDIT